MSTDLDVNQVKILKENAQQLLSQYLTLKKKYQDLEFNFNQVTSKLTSLEEDFRNKNNVEPVIVSSTDNDLVKNKLTEYIKEIDDCIALLATHE